MPYNKRFRRPRLRKITRNTMASKSKASIELNKLLEPIETLQLSDASSSVSDISDMFEDFHRDSYLIRDPVSGRRLSKYEADKLTMDQFTEDYKTAMKIAREELQLDENMINESTEEIKKVLETKRSPKNISPRLQQRIEEILKDRENIVSSPSECSEEGLFRRKESLLSFDNMSGVWRLLTMHDKTSTFTVSPPNFNAFQQEKPHWLDRPLVPWEITNQSNEKCKEWLNEPQNEFKLKSEKSKQKK